MAKKVSPRSRKAPARKKVSTKKATPRKREDKVVTVIVKAKTLSDLGPAVVIVKEQSKAKRVRTKKKAAQKKAVGRPRVVPATKAKPRTGPHSGDATIPGTAETGTNSGGPRGGNNETR